MRIPANLPGKTGSYRIAQDVQSLPRQRILCPYCMIEIAGLPQRTTTPHQAIECKRTGRLETTRDIREVGQFQFQHPVNRIRHDNPCERLYEPSLFDVVELVDYTCHCSFAFKEPAALMGGGCQNVDLADDRATAQAKAMAAHAPWWSDH